MRAQLGHQPGRTAHADDFGSPLGAHAARAYLRAADALGCLGVANARRVGRDAVVEAQRELRGWRARGDGGAVPARASRSQPRPNTALARVRAARVGARNYLPVLALDITLWPLAPAAGVSALAAPSVRARARPGACASERTSQHLGNAA